MQCKVYLPAFNLRNKHHHIVILVLHVNTSYVKIVHQCYEVDCYGKQSLKVVLLHKSYLGKRNVFIYARRLHCWSSIGSTLSKRISLYQSTVSCT